jgi:hypothetical protein
MTIGGTGRDPQMSMTILVDSSDENRTSKKIARGHIQNPGRSLLQRAICILKSLIYANVPTTL